MPEAPYIANLNSALAYLKIGRTDQARESLKRAFSQVPEDEKNGDNLAYIKILFHLGSMAISDEDYTSAAKYIEEGLSLKAAYADLLFLRLIVLRYRGAYNAMFPDVLNYLIACSAEDSGIYDYRFTNQDAIDGVMIEMLPLAYENSTDREAYMASVTRFVEATGSELFKRAREIMAGIDKTH
ncbi:MAG: tetratricopeptide repeat protein [Nitrospirae bacterium]|nr:tetratricopeptide repeat protein [Nitrospirota bacterium]